MAIDSDHRILRDWTKVAEALGRNLSEVLGRDLTDEESFAMAGSYILGYRHGVRLHHDIGGIVPIDAIEREIDKARDVLLPIDPEEEKAAGEPAA